MDIDRINAICAEIEDGKPFGKNREWDFTAAVRPADTDTGTAPADKWAMVDRLLESFNASNSEETDSFIARHSGNINQLREPSPECQAAKTVPDEKASVTDDFMARHSIKPVPGAAGNGLEEFRGKRSKEEEKMSVCLSGEEEDVCPMCQGVGSSPSISGKESVTVQGVGSSPSISGKESVTGNDIVTGKDFLSPSISGRDAAAGNDTGFSFDSESLTLTCRLTEGETARLRTLAELTAEPNHRKAFLDSLTSVYAMISVRCRHFRFWNREAGKKHLYTQIPRELLKAVTDRYARFVSVLESAGPDGLPRMIETAGHGWTKWNTETKKPVSGSVVTAARYRITEESGYVSGSTEHKMTVRLNTRYRDAVVRLFDGFVTDEDGVVVREVCTDPSEPYDMESLAAADMLTGIRSYLLIKDGYGQPVVAKYGKNRPGVEPGEDEPGDELPEGRMYSPFHSSHPFIRSFNDRSWRGSFRAFGRPLVEVYDIPSAVFSMMPRMERLRCDDADRMAGWMKTHDLYTEAAVACGLPGGRDAAKEMLQEWRSTAAEPRPGLRRLDRWMRSMWPGVAERLASYPASRYEVKDGKPRKVSGVQADYCLTETEYMKRVAAEVRDAGVMCWTLYDALYVIDTDKEKARAVLDGIDWLIRRPAPKS